MTLVSNSHRKRIVVASSMTASVCARDEDSSSAQESKASVNEETRMTTSITLSNERAVSRYRASTSAAARTRSGWPGRSTHNE